MANLQNYIVLVTGASRGAGKGIALALGGFGA
ncbi:MAG: NAD(P)-dependent dehydrogenase (short-subunit alcohol dehydrogenase family), partial [Zhongshania sp.]